MEKYMKRAIFTAALICTGTATAAYAPWTSKISEILVASTGSIYVSVGADTVINPANCKYANRYVMSVDHPGFDAIYSMLLTAMASSKEVRFHISDSTCTGDSPTITTARMR